MDTPEPTLAASRRMLATQVALAGRMLALAGHEDLTLGHVSARGDNNIVYIKRNGLGLREVTPSGVLAIDMERRKLAGEGPVHLEAVLHTEVYRHRPDVGAVVHTHPPFTTALGATTARLEMLGHDAVLFKDGLPIFDETAELIVEPDQGRAVARALGSHRAVLLRNHGVLVVGKDVPTATLAALTLERAVHIQMIASSLGPLSPMTSEMVERLYASKYREEFVEAYWQYLIRQLQQHGMDIGANPILESDQ